MKIIICSLFFAVSVFAQQQSGSDYVRSHTESFWRDVEAGRQQAQADELRLRLDRLEHERVVALRRQQAEDARRAEAERYRREVEAYNAQQQARAAVAEKTRAIEPVPSVQSPEDIQRATERQRPDFIKEFNASNAEAIRIYPDAAINGSALSRRVKEIVARLEAQKNPILNYANAPLRVTQMAALELGIAPRQ